MNETSTQTTTNEPQTVTYVLRPDGVALITLDAPGSSVNTIGEAFGRELEAAFETIAADDTVVAAVIVSAKKDFVVGADIDLISSMASPADARDKSKQLATALHGLRRKPTVAAVHGQALGGGFELALACSAIVASDDPRTAVGFPEVQLGLLPGANGLLRAADRVGLAGALDLGLTGRNVRAKKAKSMGLIDDVCPEAVLLEVAAQRAKRLAEPGKKAPKKALSTKLERLALEKNPVGRALLFKKARSEAMKKSRGNYPAIEHILSVLETYGAKGWDAAAELEAQRFGELVFTPASRALVSIFRGQTALKKDSGGTSRDPLPVERLALVGGGLMGAGIAFTSIGQGIDVRIKDRDDAGVGRGLAHVRKLLDQRVKRKRLSRFDAAKRWGFVSGSSDYTGFARTDVVIEAVFEDLELKQRVLAEVEAVTKPSAIFASNTSSLPIARIAEHAKRPDRVVGMHYFSPVEKMPLLEVVRTEHTADEVVATAVALGKKQGKTVIVVNDGVGFYTTRILAPYLNEAAHLLAEGVAIEVIDDALMAWGWPVGPMQLIDEVGIDVGAHVGEITEQAFGERMRPPPAMAKVLADDRKGRKNGRGFYLYEKGKRQGVDTSIYPLVGVTPDTELEVQEIQLRASLAFVNEALRAFGDGIVCSPRDGDIGAVFGLGFPPFRGGPFRYVDAEGAGKVLARLKAYEQRFGARFTPAPILEEYAAQGRKFYPEG